MPTRAMHAGMWVPGLWVAIAAGQVVPDGSMGTTVMQAGNTFTIDGGRRIGANQFHSLQRLSVGAGQTAAFADTPGVARVLARVTGGEASRIDGTLRCATAGASLFLINPAGIVFGSGSQLDVSGAFAATTADVVTLADGSRFTAAISGADATLSTAAPASFGFLRPAPAGITVEPDAAPLAGAPGQPLTLIAGDITINNRDVTSTGGRIVAVSAAQPTTVAMDATANSGNVDLSRPATGKLVIHQGALDSSDTTAAAGSIVIRGGRLVVVGSGTADPLVIDGLRSRTGSQSGGVMDLAIDRAVVLRDGGRIVATTDAAGDAGRIHLQSPRVTLQNSGRIQSVAPENTSGNSGGIDIRTDQLDIRNRSFISSSTLSSGNAGDIRIFGLRDEDVQRLTINGHRTSLDDGMGGATGIFSDTQFKTDPLGVVFGGQGGTINIGTDTLRMRNAAQISADTLGSGLGGIVWIRAGTIDIDGSDFNQPSTAIGSFVEFSGSGGLINVLAERIRIANGAAIISNATVRPGDDPGDSTGNAGRVRVTATESLAIVNDPGPRQTKSTGIAAVVERGASGAGGTVIARAPQIIIRGVRAQISAASRRLGSGPAGNVRVDADRMLITDRGLVNALADDNRAGRVVLNATDTIEITDRGRVSTLSRADASGNIAINARRQVALRGGSITAKAGEDGARITIDPEVVLLQNSFIDGRAGGTPEPVTIIADNLLRQNTTILTDALITFVETNLSGNLVRLGEGLKFDPVLVEDCVAEILEGTYSSLLIKSRGGTAPLATEPFALPPPPLTPDP